jgi:hypothetical protein
MADLTDKTSSDSVSSNDINTLLKGTPFYNPLRKYGIKERIIDETDGGEYKSLEANNIGNLPSSSPTKWESTDGGGSAPDFEASFPAGSFDLPATNYAPLSTDTGTNGTIQRHLFDDTTEEQVEAQFVLPSAIAGTVTFEVYGYSVSPLSDKRVEFTFYHSAKANSENWDASYNTKVSGDLTVDSFPDGLDRLTFTETVSNLGWTANDHVRIKLGRTAPSEKSLVGDYGVTHFKIIVPRA